MQRPDAIDKGVGKLELKDFFREHPKAALAFSGGVDSAYLFYAALHHGADVTAYFAKTPFQPAFALADARRMAAALGGRLRVLELDLLSDPEIAANSPERCYYCKKRMFAAVADAARQDGYTLLLDGSNASDPAADRPGMRAARELDVRSPLRSCGLDKAAIRGASREAGLFTWDKPAYSCLATRIAPGEALTAQRLRAVEQAETYLMGLGFSDLRVRTAGGDALLQLRREQLPALLERREEILTELKRLFGRVTLDLEVRE